MMDKSKRPGTMIYFSDIKPALNRMDDAQCGRLLRAIVWYAETGEQPELDGVEALVFDMLIPKIDRDGERYEESREQRQYAVYCRETKKKGEQPLTISEWRLLRLSSSDNGPISPDIGRYPSTSTFATASTSASTTTTASAFTDASTVGKGTAGGFRGEEGGNQPPPSETLDQRRARLIEELEGYEHGSI